MAVTASVKVADVAPERVPRWVEGFAERHGLYNVDSDPREVRLRAEDGAEAVLDVPFPPMAGTGLEGLLEHATRPRTVGVVLVRLGGYAAGVFEGERLIASKVGSRLVHGRHKAGGRSQRRFARRRDKQAAEAMSAAADVAARILLSHPGELDAVVFGGDRRAVERLRDDVRLVPLFDRAVDRFLTVPDPKLTVLKTAPGLFRAVRIRVKEP